MKKFLTLVFISSFFSSTGKIAFIDFNNSIDQNNEATYTVKFYNDDFTLLSSKKYAVGETPISPSTPSKENPLPEYNYTFNGWAPSISIVTDDIDYVATYKTDVKTGKVIWVDGDGEILATDTYAYGTMPHYQGSIPTKTPTATEKFVFKGWGTVSPILAEETTYVAQFDPIPIPPPSSKNSLRITCENCLVNKKKEIIEEYNPNTSLSYQFSNTSAATYHYPYNLNVKVDGEVSNDYTYDNSTGELKITLTGNTEIEAIADNSCVLMKYEYSSESKTISFNCTGDFEYVDWGDIIDTNKTHTYSGEEGQIFTIRIYGKLSEFSISSSAIQQAYIFHSIKAISDNAFKNCSELSSISIPSNITSIGTNAFYGCSSLLSINIPNGVTSVGDYAFYKCSKLSSIYIPSGIVSIGNHAFDYCEQLNTVTFENQSSLKTIDNYAFRYCSVLNQITIPKSVTSIGDYAFQFCEALESVSFGNESILTNLGKYAFGNCSVLDSFVIPRGITSIDEMTFGNCKALSTITIHNGITSINRYAFQDCHALAAVDFEENSTLKTIGEGAFLYCTGLETITIPNSVNSMDRNAFFDTGLSAFDLSSLDHVITIPTEGIFGNKCPTIKIKNGMLETYKNNSKWEKYSSYMVGV